MYDDSNTELQELYEETADQLREFHTEGERHVYEYMREKQRFKKRKRNNVKKPPQEKPQQVQLRCQQCNGCDFVQNVDTSDTVCTQCATVAILNDSRHNFDHDTVSASSQTSAQLNYFNERMSQWCMREPSIPVADSLRLRDTFRGGAGTDDTGPFDPFLPKHEVRRLVIAAGLAPKVYVEKWLSIRRMLGAPVHPYPSTDELPNAMRDMFKAVLSAWKQSRPEVGTSTGLHPKRSSLINYNFLIHQFLLILDIEAYKLYSPWFPLVVESKQRELKRLWHSMCIKLGWPMLEAEWHGDELKVYKLKTIN